MVMSHIYTKGQGQKSLGSKIRVETDGGTTDGWKNGRNLQRRCINLLSVLTWSLINQTLANNVTDEQTH